MCDKAFLSGKNIISKFDNDQLKIVGMKCLQDSPLNLGYKSWRFLQQYSPN